jgi:hypothetical protein
MRLKLYYSFLLPLLVASIAVSQPQHFLQGSPSGSQNTQTVVAFDSQRTSTSVPFTLVDDRIFVNVKLNGEGPFAFLFDTGGNAVIGAKVAERLHLASGNTETGTGMGEKPVTAVDTTVREVQIGDLRLSNLAFHAIAMDDTPAVFGRQPVDGIIGFPILEQLIVEVDYQSKSLKMTLPSAYTPRKSGTTVHFTRARWVPLIDASLDGVPGKFGVDTGARLSLLLYGPFVKQNNLRAKYHPEVSGVTGWGLGGPIRSQLARGQQFVIDNLTIHDPLVRLPLQTSGGTTASDTAGVIGSDILRQFNITFDYGSQTITFEKNDHYGAPSNFDRVGLWLGQDSAGFTVVDVVSGSPADIAGIKVGDDILAIDGRSAATLDLVEVREEFRNDPAGKKMQLKVESGATVREIVVTLRELV